MCDTLQSIQDEGKCHEMVYFPITLTGQLSVLISAVATTIAVLTSLAFKLYKRPLSRMVLAINIVDILFYYTKLSVLVFQPQSDLHCKFLGIVNVFGIGSSAIWAAFFAHGFYITLKYQNVNEILRMMKYYVIVGVLPPIINGVMGFETHYLVYSENHKTCVHLLYSGEIDIPFSFYVNFPIAFACFMSIIWYKMAINKISDLHEMQIGAELYVLMIYPGILILCWGPTLFIHTSIQFGANPSQTLIQSFIFLVNLQGFFDAIVYGSSIRDLLKRFFRSSHKRELSKEEQIFVEPQVLDDKSDKLMSAGSYSILSMHSDCEINRNQ